MATTRPVQRSAQRHGIRLQIRTPGNRFDIDEDRIPVGMTYEWKRMKFMGLEDIEHLVNLDSNGWLPVPADRHPELAGTRLQKGADIVRGGLCLMERPCEITAEARELDEFASKAQISHQLQRLGLQGQRADRRGVRTRVGPPPDAMPVDDDP